MAHQITDSDKQRMQEFATTPKYQRSPHLLQPEDGDDGDEESRT